MFQQLLQSTSHRRRLSAGVALVATALSLRLLPEVLADPKRWSKEQWWLSRSYFYGLYS